MGTITITVHTARNFIEQLIGLIGQKPYPLLLKTRWGIHTFGMKELIDVVILDNHLIIRKLKRSLPPNRLFFWNPRYNQVLELPEGWIKRHNLKTGCHIELKRRV